MLLWVFAATHSRAQNFTFPRIALDSVHYFTLENDLQVAVVEDHQTPSISFRLYLGEPLPGESRIARITAESLVRGNKKLDPKQYRRVIDSLGMRFISGEDGIIAQCLSKQQDSVLSFISETILSADFSPATIATLDSTFSKESFLAPQEPLAIANVVSTKIMHPFTDTTTIDSANCATYFKQKYVPNNALLVVVGDVTVDSLRKELNAHFESWEKGSPSISPANTTPKQAKRVVLVHSPETDPALIFITIPISLHDNQRLETDLQLLSTALGGHPGSRLNERLRMKNGLSLGLVAQLSRKDDLHYMTIHGGIRAEAIDTALYQVLYEIERLREDRIDAASLALVKRIASNRYVKSLERPLEVANLIKDQILHNLPTNFYNGFTDSLKRRRPLDLLKTANRYIHPDSSLIVVVGDRFQLTAPLMAVSRDSTVEFYDADGNSLDYAAFSGLSETAPETVLDRYIDTIGMTNRLDSIQSLQSRWTGNFNGTSIQLAVDIQKPDRYLMQLTMDSIPIFRTHLKGDTV